MKTLLKKIWEILLPSFLQIFIYEKFYVKITNSISRERRKRAKRIVNFFQDENNQKNYPEEYTNAANWIKKNGYNAMPYDFIKEYQKKKIKVFEDAGFKYIIHENKRLYFPKNRPLVKCLKLYKGLSHEQDKRSPHRYNYSWFQERKGWTLLDIGAAEGIFALSVIDYVDKVYLFECDDYWIEALNKTFEPYKDKVEIIKAYVSDENTESTVTLDFFMKNVEYVNCYIKMDIEGYEVKVLDGAKDFLKNCNNIFISTCVYHRDEHEKEINSTLTDKGFSCTLTNGLIALGSNPPYFRKGVLYASKTN